MTELEIAVNALTVAIVLLVPFDVYVAWSYARAAVRRPHIEALTASALSTAGVATAAVLAGILGINRLIVIGGGPAFLDGSVALLLLALALVVVSLPNLYKVRLLKRWSQGEWSPTRHRRIGDRTEREHRRRDDPPTDKRFHG